MSHSAFFFLTPTASKTCSSTNNANNFVLNSQLLESSTAEVLIGKLHQELCIHMRQQGGHFKRKPQSDEPGVTEVPHTQTVQHTKYIQEI